MVQSHPRDKQSHLSQFFLECLQLSHQRFNLGFQHGPVFRIQRCGPIFAQDEQIQRYNVLVREPHKQIHRAAPFAGLNVAQKAPVNIQRRCQFFLSETVFRAELPDLRPAFLMFSCLRILGEMRSEREVTGISLCRAAIASLDSKAMGNRLVLLKNDKTERQTVLLTVWRSVLLFLYMYLSSGLGKIIVPLYNQGYTVKIV